MGGPLEKAVTSPVEFLHSLLRVIRVIRAVRMPDVDEC
jgi:hypothetical protein